MTTVAINLTDPAATAASVRQLNPGQRELLLSALCDARDGDATAALLVQVRAVIAEEYPWADMTGQQRGGGPVHPATPLAVLFGTTEADNGWFLDPQGQVVRADGSTEKIDFGVELERMFTDRIGCRSRNYTLGVDLRTGRIEDADHPEGVRDFLGLPSEVRDLMPHRKRGDVRLGRHFQGATQPIPDEKPHEERKAHHE
jgi:hypothetical protein